MLQDSVVAVARALEGSSVRYLVVGGMAVVVHGHERFTKDLDLVVDLDAGNLRRAFSALAELGYRPVVPIRIEEFLDPENRRSWMQEKNMLVLQLWSDAYPRLPIDIFLSEPFDFEAAFDAALREPLTEDLNLKVLDLERLMKMKADAGRGQDQSDLEILNRIAEIRRTHE